MSGVMSSPHAPRVSVVWSISLLLLLLLSLALTLCVVSATKVNCYMKDNMLLQQKACFQREGIDIALPSTTLKASKEQRKTDLLNSLIENEPEMLCRQKEKFQRALPCVMDQARECMPAQYQGYLPNPDFMTKTLDKLCNNETDVNFSCVKNMAERLFDCTFRKGKTAFEDVDQDISARDVLCKAFELSIACQKEVFRHCGCETTRVYTDIYLDYIYPPACPPIGHIHNHVTCNDTSGFDAYSSLSNHSPKPQHDRSTNQGLVLLASPSKWKSLALALFLVFYSLFLASMNLN